MRILRLIFIFAFAVCSLRGYASGELRLKTRDIVYSATTQRLYVSVPSEDVHHPNTVTTIDPRTYKIGASFPVPGDPGKLALSDDGRYLYVALEGPSSIACLNLITQTCTPFSLGPGGSVEDMAVLPGHPDSVAAARRNVGLVIYDHGVPRPNTKGSGNRIAFAGSPTVLYSCSSNGSALYKNTIDATGIVTSAPLPIQIPATYEIKTEADRLYSVSGRVIDLKTERIIGNFPGLKGYYSVAPDARRHHIFFQCGNLIKEFDDRTLELIGQMDFPAVNGNGPIGSLVLWGKDGLAFRTQGGQILWGSISEFQPPNAPGASEVVPRGTVQLAPYSDSSYKYLVLAQQNALPLSFEKADFQDAAWPSGKAPFGNSYDLNCPPTSKVQTLWHISTDMLVRKHVFVPVAQAHLQIRINVDDQIMNLFFNGQEISGPLHGDGCDKLDALHIDVPPYLVQKGDNLVAVHVRDTGGYAYFDMRTLSLPTVPGSPIEPVVSHGPVIPHGPHLLLSWEALEQTWQVGGSAPGIAVKGILIAQNVGDQAVPSGSINLFLAQDRSLPTPDAPIRKFAHVSLPVGEKQRIPVDLKLLASSKPFGKFLIAADSISQAGTFPVAGAGDPSAGPILTPINLMGVWGQVSQIANSVDANQHEVQGDFILTNSGQEESPRYGVRFYLASGPHLTRQDTLLAGILVPPIAPGKQHTIKIQRSLPHGTTAAGKYLIAVMNANRAVIEIATTNKEISVGPLP